jgi:acetylornithine/N-succinyldiaminopimelate aminotransferase
MSDMDEPEETVDPISDQVSDRGMGMSEEEKATNQIDSFQNESQGSLDVAGELPVENDRAVDDEVVEEFSEDRHDDEEVVEESDDEYEEESEEDDEYEDESEEDGEYEEESEEDDEYEEESEEDDEYEDESEEDGDYADESGNHESEAEEVGERDQGSAISPEDDAAISDGVAEDSLETETQERGSEPSLQSLKGDRFQAPETAGEGEVTAQSGDSGRHAELQFQPVELPVMRGEPFGMLRADKNGCELLDAMAGRNSVFGFGCTPIRESLVSGLSGHLGEGSCFADVEDDGDSPLSKRLQELFDGANCVSVDSMALLPSPDLAVEYALQLTRRFRSEKAFRTIALTGSDHGRTGMCRTASGRPQLHEGLGPMMAGFSHLPMGDLDALRAAMDEQTAGVILSTIDLGSRAVACEAEYLAGVRAACNERGALLIIDETQLVFGATGNHFSFSGIADIQADIVVASGGLFAGLPGGLVLASQHASTRVVRDLHRYPLLAAALLSTLDEMQVHGLPAVVQDTAQELAVLIAEQLSGFEFVRDMRVTGLTIGIECDVNALDVVAAAAANGLRVEPAGDTAILIQPPLLISAEDRQLLLKRLVETMEAIERETAGLAI